MKRKPWTVQALSDKKLEVVGGAGLIADLKAVKPNKFRNRKVVVDGILFDSQLEADRWWVLKALQQYKLISELQRQVKFELLVKDQKICCFIADFSYMRDGVLVVEDTKSEITRKLPAYRIKKKLLKAILGIDIVEITK